MKHKPLPNVMPHLTQHFGRQNTEGLKDNLAGPSAHVSVWVQGGVVGHSLRDTALGEEGGPGLKTTTHCLSPGVPDGHLGSSQDSPLPLKPVVSAREGHSQLG